MMCFFIMALKFHNYRAIFYGNNMAAESSDPYDFLDDDGSISDIGATSYVNNDCSIAGDVNFDNEINVLDINIIINYIIANISLDSLDFSISDMNVDGIINVIDIVDIVNIILDS